jgi:hypothetical protein
MRAVLSGSRALAAHDVSHPGQTLDRLRPPHRRDGEQCDVIELRLVESLSYGPTRM